MLHFFSFKVLVLLSKKVSASFTFMPIITDLFGPPPVEDEDDDIFGSKGKFVSKGLFDDDDEEEVCITYKLLFFFQSKRIDIIVISP